MTALMAGKMTENDLCEKFWWWRKGSKDWNFDTKNFTTKLSSSANSAWKEGKELVAWWYELLIRHDRKAQHLPYLKADPFLLLLLEEFSPVKPWRQVLRVDALPVASDLLVIDAKSWSDILQVQCDLSASDHELSSSFLSFVRRLRRERKIKSPSGPKGKRNRPVSWRWPELLDIKHYMPVEKLDDAERSKLSKAQKLAKTLNEYVNSRLQPDSDEDFTPVRLGDLRKTLIV